MAIDFDGVDDYVDCGSGATIDDLFNGGGSLAAIIRLTNDPPDGAVDRIANKGDGTVDGWNCAIRNEAGATAYDRSLHFRAALSTTDGVWAVDEAQTPANGTWFSLVVLWNDDGNPPGAPSFYVDGILKTTDVRTAPSGTYVSDATSSLQIGHPTLPVDADIDDFRCFNRSLSAKEIALHAAGYLGPLGGEVLWLSCADFAGVTHPDGTTLTTSNVMTDLSGNGNDGVPTNSPVARASDAPRYLPFGFAYSGSNTFTQAVAGTLTLSGLLTTVVSKLFRLFAAMHKYVLTAPEHSYTLTAPRHDYTLTAPERS